MLTVVGCSPTSPEAEPGPSSVPQEQPKAASKPKPKPKPVVLLFAQVLERHRSVDAVLDFVEADEQGRGRFEGIRVTSDGRDPEAGRALLGADRAALVDYLDSVFSRRPELRPPPEIGLAYGAAPRLAKRGASAPVRAYWLDPTQQLRVTHLRSATVVEDNVGVKSVRVALHESDREAFGSLTEQALGHEVAIVSAEEVLSAPRVNEAITGGVIHITLGTPWTEESTAEASALARRLLGETDSATP